MSVFLSGSNKDRTLNGFRVRSVKNMVSLEDLNRMDGLGASRSFQYKRSTDTSKGRNSGIDSDSALKQKVTAEAPASPVSKDGNITTPALKISDAMRLGSTKRMENIGAMRLNEPVHSNESDISIPSKTVCRTYWRTQSTDMSKQPNLINDQILPLKQGELKVRKAASSVSKAGNIRTSLPVATADKDELFSSTAPMENTGAMPVDGLVYSSANYTSIPSKKCVTDINFSRSLVGLRSAHDVDENGRGVSSAVGFENGKAENGSTTTENLACSLAKDGTGDSTNTPIHIENYCSRENAITNTADAIVKSREVVAKNIVIVNSHYPDKASHTETSCDETTKDYSISVSVHNTGMVQDAVSADHDRRRRHSLDEKHFTHSMNNTAHAIIASHDSKTGYDIKAIDDNRTTQGSEKKLDTYSTTDNVDLIQIYPGNDISSDDCSVAADTLPSNVLPICNNKPSKRVKRRVNPNHNAASTVPTSESYTTSDFTPQSLVPRLATDSPAIRKSHQPQSSGAKEPETTMAGDWQVVVRLHDTPEKMNRQDVAEYLANISTYKLNQTIVRITQIDPSTGKIAVSVNCPTEELQTNFLDAVKESGHMVCAKQKEADARTSIKLRINLTCSGLEIIDKALVVEYIRMVTDATLDEEDLEEDSMNCAAADRCVYWMNCYGKDEAKALTDSINDVSSVTGMTAAPLTGEDLTIQGLWDEVFNGGQGQMTRHHEKVSEVSEEITKINNEGKNESKKRFIDYQDYERRQARKEPLIGKLQELQSQEAEFVKYMDKLQSQVFNLKGNPNLKVAAQTLRTEFKLELDRFTSALPMYAKKTAIVNTVRSNRVSIILGETGSGKSTQILQYLHEAGFTREGLIVCTQPRKVAALSLACRVAEEMGGHVGQLVGYQVGMQAKRSAETKLLYVTDHILLNDCLKDPLFSQYSCIVIDEAHERSIYTDLLLGFIKRSLPRRSDLKVIITSATIDPEVFINYFDGSPTVVKVSGRAFPVDVIYDTVNYDDDNFVTAAVDKSLWVHTNKGPGDVLVFLTSPIETEKACKKLKDCVQQTVIALEVNGRQQLEEQQKVFDPTPAGKRKIVFATNSAETSVTIPGIKYVIDTGKIREMNYDSKKSMSVLGLTWTTKSSADQRKGRAGRTDSGYCYRLYKQEKYDEMRPNSVPEILRIHLGQALLKLLMLGIDDPMKFQFVESPKREAIEEALAVLEELGAYSVEVGITEIGKKLSQIAVEPRLGKVALRGIEEGVGYEAMIVTAVCSAGGSVFFRAGSAEEKQASDRTKTKFCDEWGDMITGAMIFKEWDQLPMQSRGGWCKTNSINGKTMKVAKDLLKEIMQTFQQDLKIMVNKKFSDDPKLNEKLAKILLECYPSQLARFLGHERIGYCLANNPKQSLRLHPSSSLLYMETPPTWVIYQQILNTTDVFMTNVTFVDESWVDEQLSNGKLKINVDRLKEEIISPDKFCGLGKQCILRLLDRKAQALRDLEDGIKKDSTDENPRLSIQFDSKRKLIVVYAEQNIKELAKAKVQLFLDEVRNFLRDETIEQQIRKSSNVRFVLGSGLRIKSILMPGEQRQLAIFCNQTPPCEMKRVCEVLRKYGEIESYTLNRQPNSPVFGFVTFKNAEDADAAAKDRSMQQSGFRVEKSLKDAAFSKSRSANFCVKVEICRRPLTGFGYVQLHSGEVAERVLSKMDSFKINKKTGQNRIVEAIVEVSENRKNYDQIRLSNIPEWATPCIIRSVLQKVIGSKSPGQDMVNVVLVRKPPPPEFESQRIYQTFRGLIMQRLMDSLEFSARDFEVQMNEPKDKDYTMFAYLRFENPDKAASAADLLDGVGFGSQVIEAKLDLRTSFVVSDKVYGTCKQDVENEVSHLNETSAGIVAVRMERRQNGSYLIQVETSELEDLKEARARLDEVIYGHRLDIDSRKFAQLKTEAAMKKKEEIQKRARVRIRLDDRQETLFIYGQRASVEKANRLLDEYLSQTKANVSKEISLRDDGYPRGTMKALVGQYGSNLEKLRSLCCAFNLELNLKRHTIRFHGTHESYEQLKALIEERAALIPGPRIEPEPAPDCSVCLSCIDYDDCYVLEFCGHFYCSDCARDLVRNGLSNNTIPIGCVVEGCGAELVLKDFQNLLSRIEETFDSAIRSFMATCDKEFAYCTTPDCPMIYRKGKKEGTEFICGECHVSICTKCDQTYHPGMTCETYCSFFVKADSEMKIWLMGDTVRRALCPKCGIGIEKIEGCNHMECTSCKAHICWKCKKHFPQSDACYQHLRNKHGGYYDND